MGRPERHGQQDPPSATRRKLAASQPAGPSHSHGSASSSAPGASAGAQMYLCGGACGSMLEMTAFSKAQLKKLRKGGQGSCITCTEAAERMRQHTIPLSEEDARRKRQKVQAVHAHKTLSAGSCKPAPLRVSTKIPIGLRPRPEDGECSRRDRMTLPSGTFAGHAIERRPRQERVAPSGERMCGRWSWG